jgi:hypothetical protein
MELTTLRSRLPNAVSSNSSNSLTALSAAAEVLIQTRSRYFKKEIAFELAFNFYDAVFSS